MAERKYKLGRKLTASEAIAAIERGEFLYLGHKITHPGWSQNWQIRMLIHDCDSGLIWSAIKIEKEK